MLRLTILDSSGLTNVVLGMITIFLWTVELLPIEYYNRIQINVKYRVCDNS